MSVHILHRLFFCSVLWIFSITTVSAQETVPAVTGEYPPYTGEKLPSGGIATAIVDLALKAAGFAKTDVLWTSWTRGHTLTKVGKVAMTFPYVHNEERTQDFLFSDPLYTDRISYFVRPQDLNGLSGAWHEMRICLPQGWAISLHQDFIDQFSLSLLQPISMKHCFNMLDAKRVDIVPCADHVAAYETKNIFGKSDVFAVSNYAYLERKYYAMISRNWLDAEDLRQKLNIGLTKIRNSGAYARILEPYQINSHE